MYGKRTDCHNQSADWFRNDVENNRMPFLRETLQTLTVYGILKEKG